MKATTGQSSAAVVGLAQGSDRYPSIDELVRAARCSVESYPGVCALREVGVSRMGEPLWLLSVGEGARRVLVVGGPHANEPIGGATIVRLVAALCRNPRLRADTAWHFLLCLDPDGARLNEGWARAPGSIAAQFRGFYRPAAGAQPEWLPEAGAEPALPETTALLCVLDELRPHLQFSLHANDVGGAWVQLTHNMPAADRALAAPAAKLGIPLAAGPVDTFHMPSPHPGVFVMPTPDRLDRQVVHHDWLVRSTWFHAARSGTRTAVVETPLWAVPQAADSSPVREPDVPLEAAVTQLRTRARHVGRLLDAAPHQSQADNPMLEAARWLTGACTHNADQWESAASSTTSHPVRNIAGAFALRMSAQRLPLRAAAMLARAFDGIPGGDKVQDAVQTQIDEWCAQYEAEFRPRWIPVHLQTMLQTQFALEVANSSAAQQTGRPQHQVRSPARPRVSSPHHR